MSLPHSSSSAPGGGDVFMPFRSEDPATALYKVLFSYLCDVCVHLEVRGQLEEFGFLLLPHGSSGWSSGQQP